MGPSEGALQRVDILGVQPLFWDLPGTFKECSLERNHFSLWSTDCDADKFLIEKNALVPQNAKHFCNMVIINYGELRYSCLSKLL